MSGRPTQFASKTGVGTTGLFLCPLQVPDTGAGVHFFNLADGSFKLKEAAGSTFAVSLGGRCIYTIYLCIYLCLCSPLSLSLYLSIYLFFISIFDLSDGSLKLKEAAGSTFAVWLGGRCIYIYI